jgi:hypothetical protein
MKQIDLHVSLPKALVSRMKETAEAEQMTLNELVSEALDVYFRVLNTPATLPGLGGDDLRRFRNNRRSLASTTEADSE